MTREPVSDHYDSIEAAATNTSSLNRFLLVDSPNGTLNDFTESLQDKLSCPATVIDAASTSEEFLIDSPVEDSQEASDFMDVLEASQEERAIVAIDNADQLSAQVTAPLHHLVDEGSIPLQNSEDCIGGSENLVVLLSAQSNDDGGVSIPTEVKHLCYSFFFEPPENDDLACSI